MTGVQTCALPICIGIGSDMRLEAVNGWLSLVLDPACVTVFLTGGGNDGGINQRTGFDGNCLGFELCSHRFEQQAIQPLSNQGFAEADKCRALGRSLGA